MFLCDTICTSYKSTEIPDITVNTVDGVIWVTPKSESVKGYFVLVPGALVEPSAYIRLASLFTEQGICVGIPSTWINLPILNPNIVTYVMNMKPQTKEWYVGGHSQGGVVATWCKDERIVGYFLLASYPTSTLNKRTISLIGSNDKVLNMTRYENAKKYLPRDRKFITINGGNHALFGTYGIQKGDGEATITREEQQKITCDEIVNFFINL